MTMVAAPPSAAWRSPRSARKEARKGTDETDIVEARADDFYTFI